MTGTKKRVLFLCNHNSAREKREMRNVHVHLHVTDLDSSRAFEDELAVSAPTTCCIPVMRIGGWA
jgi:hypothetical protein